MISKIDIQFTWTSDNLKLQGVHFPSENKDLCVLFVHGMSGNYVDNYFGHVLGEVLQQNKFGYIFTHNRGAFHINDLQTNEKNPDGTSKFERIGVVYERFEGCVVDIEAWLQKAREIGYKRFVIVGHSLGGPKVVHHFFKNRPKDVVGLVLASPGDMVGLAKKPEYQPNYTELLAEAKSNVAQGKPRELVTGLIWNWYQLSSQTFVDLFEENGPADVLPLLRNPDKFPELAIIDRPILCTMGEFDDITIRTLPEDLELLKNKAISCPSFETCLIPNANHSYENQEQVFADEVKKWLQKNFKELSD